MVTGNKTIREYWDGIWQAESNPNNIKPDEPNIRNYTNQMLHAYFKRIFASLDTNQSKLLEIGCANSVWLPYFNKEFGFNISGLDYSEIGCKRTRQNLEMEGVEGEVVCADLFNPPSKMQGNYDAVVSFGVVEHFEDTSNCLQALSMFLKKGGIMITIIPNMTGSVGFVQKHLNRPIFDIHVPINREELMRAHEKLDCVIIENDYFMSTNYGVCNLNGIPQKSIEWIIKKAILASLTRASMLTWLIEKRFGALPARRFFSPYINCVARKI